MRPSNGGWSSRIDRDLERCQRNSAPSLFVLPAGETVAQGTGKCARTGASRSTTANRISGGDHAAIDDVGTGFIVPREAGGDGYTLVTQVQSGIPVDARLLMRYGGPYGRIVRSVQSGTVLSASDSVSMPDCSGWPNTIFETQWTPPGPGTYTVEFRIEPRGTLPDDPATNRVTKTLTVLASTDARAEGAR